jgi:adenine-specific DNA-methyltransferase
LDAAKKSAQQVLKRGKWPLYYFTRNGEGGIAKKTYLNPENGKVATNLWLQKETGNTDEAKKELLSLFDGRAPFDTPKPTRLIRRIMDVSIKDEGIVLDFFSGSATTAHAVMLQNSINNSSIKFLLVQIPEKIDNQEYQNLCDVGKERIRRAGKKILEEQKEKQGDLFSDDQKPLDVGFRVFKCADNNMKDVYYTPSDYDQQMLFDLEDNVKEDRNDLDLLFGCMLDWGVTLDLPLRSEKVDGVTIHIVNEGDLVACFDQNIPESAIDHIASLLPMRVVLRDSCFNEAKEKMNFFEIFKQRTGWREEEVRKNVKVI